MINMPSLSWTVCNYSRDNSENFLKSFKKARNLDFSGDILLFESIEKGIKKPGYSPDKDLFLAVINKEIIGWVNMIPELGIKRVILDGFVFPYYRRKGIASSLFCFAFKRAQDLLAEKTHVCFSQKNKTAVDFCESVGFRSVRNFVNLRLKLSALSLKKHNINLPKHDYFGPGQEKELADIQNNCFSDSWGFNPNTVEDIQFWLNITHTSLRDVLIEKQRKEILGYCWTQMISLKNHGSNQKKGRIHMIGVQEKYRGKGIGKRLLLAGLVYLKEKGAEVVDLTLDEENTSAYTLYKSLGFSPISRNVWYEKKI